MKRKNILIDIKTVIPLYTIGYITGIGRSTYELLKALHELELPFDITLFSQNTRGVTAKKEFPKFKYLHFYVPDRPLFRRVLEFFKLKYLLTNYSLLHLPNNTQQEPEIEERTIYTIHDLAVCEFPEMWGVENNKKFFEDLKRKLLLCKGIITCSEYSRQSIIKFAGVNPNKVTTIPWGVNQEVFKPTFDEEVLNKYHITPNFFFTSSCNHPRKNAPILLQAYIQYLNNGGQRQLVMLNPLDNQIESYHDLIKNNKIKILRNVTDHELVALYSYAHCSFVLSSFEGFGLPIIESLACGTQVVSSRNTSLPEVGGDVVLYINNLDVEELYRILEKIDHLPKDILLDKNKCNKLLKKFTWNSCARAYCDFYNQML